MHNKYLRSLSTILGVILLSLCSFTAQAQHPLVAVPSANTSTLGNQVNNTTDDGNNGYAVGSIWYTGGQPLTVTSCSVFVVSGTVGGLVDCGLLAAPTTSTNGGQWVCHGSFTETSTNPNAVITAPVTGCTLSAQTAYWIVLNTNDAALVDGAYNCGGTCSGVANSGTQDGFYAANTYGDYGPGSVPTAWDGNTGIQEYVFITYSVPNSGVARPGSMQ
jgi:hypothetical protein